MSNGFAVRPRFETLTRANHVRRDYDPVEVYCFLSSHLARYCTSIHIFLREMPELERQQEQGLSIARC